MSGAPTIVWLRQDLRVADQPALRFAVERGGPVIPLYIWAPDEEGDWPPGGAARWWTHHALVAVDEALRKLGAPLVVRRGPSLDTLRELAHDTGADAVAWNRRYEPAIIERDTAIKESLRKSGIDARSFNGSLLFEPWDVQTGSGDPYKVFSPFWRNCTARPDPDEPAPAPRKLTPLPDPPASLAMDELELLPTIPWDAGIRAAWTPGEQAAQKRLRHFVDAIVSGYADGRDRPDQDSTSMLSPFLHHGELSPRQVWHAVQRGMRDAPAAGRKGAASYLRELGWREFGYHLLVHFPHTPTQCLREQFSAFPWASDADHLRAWQRGRTGYPMVDAGMRQLWQTGWMHNRVRMVVASFLVKHLRLHWLEGARWFWDTLVDADLASNTLGWQWSAGCGADAAPYFRVFNPVLQGTKFDPAGDYVRRFIPELADVDGKFVHSPWEAPPLQRPADYPAPIVDHKQARDAALDAYSRITG